jgi:hypothetical protein
MALLRDGRPDDQYVTYANGTRRFPKGLPRVVCADGFSLSIQAGKLLYSTPRHDAGPWSHVEVGFPSERPEPWADWTQYCEDPQRPTNTVYGYVPLEMVEALVALHGGAE